MSPISSPSRSTASSAPGCGPDAVAIAPVTTITAQPTMPTSATSRSQRGATGCPEPARVPPRLERDDHGEGDHDEREQEVRHHRERVEVEDHREAAQRDLGDGAEEGRERHPAHPPRQPVDAPGREPRHERGEDPESATTRFPNSTIAWKSLAGTACRRIAASCRSRGPSR